MDMVIYWYNVPLRHKDNIYCCCILIFCDACVIVANKSVVHLAHLPNRKSEPFDVDYNIILNDRGVTVWYTVVILICIIICSTKWQRMKVQYEILKIIFLGTAISEKNIYTWLAD